jgi:transcriptional regulator with XRE-family HTH domain
MTKEEFKAWRKRLGLTQAQAGDALGLTGEHINRLEKGISPRGTPLEISTVIALACEALENRHSEKNDTVSEKGVDD